MYKVFLVEDEIVVREGIRNDIPWEQTPYSLAGEAPDGETALAMIHDVKPDIIITDIRMPFMDGLTLSRIVKKSLPWIKIIILSGHDEFEYAREAISIGVEEYLLKPVSSRDMLKTLDKIAGHINKEKENLQNIENLKAQVRSSADMLRDKWLSDFINGRISPAEAIEQGRELNIDLLARSWIAALKAAEGGEHDLSEFPEINGDMFLIRLRYAEEKDIDAIIREYTKTLDNNFDEMTAYFILGEIVVAASKIVEELDGSLKEIVPFSLEKGVIRSMIASRSAFIEKLAALLTAVIEYRNAHIKGRFRKVVVKAREYINRHFASGNISLYSTASYVGISPNHLSAVFAHETGEKFIEYLTRIRLEKAMQLLQNTAMKSADIAFETGFNDPHYFSHIFKKNVGVSPREYRLSHT